MKILKLLLIILAVTYVFSQGTPQQDRVNLLVPGYYFPWYSGYLNVSKNTAFYYVFFFSQSDATNDPVILWLNGGPGCSSLYGMTYENGPFVFKENTTVFDMNPYAWNKKANVLYIESPGQVGFSTGNTNHSDTSVSVDNLQALKSFFNKFSRFRKNDFYLSGQSYAGIYVPTLAYAIHLYNQNPSTLFPLNLKGFIVGNACTDPQQCYTTGLDGTSLFQYQFLYKHAFYTEQQYNILKAACSNYDSFDCYSVRNILDDKYAKLNTTIDNIYKKCYYQPLPNGKRLKAKANSRILKGQLSCDDDIGQYKFFNDPVIREYLHVNKNTSFVWYSCSDEVWQQYIMEPEASFKYYPILMKAGYKMWVYSGDVDGNVVITGTLFWLNRLQSEYNIKTLQPWRQWWVKGDKPNEAQVGGMVWKLQNLTFISVRNSGHMVPRDQPASAYTMIQSYLNDVELPTLHIKN